MLLPTKEQEIGLTRILEQEAVLQREMYKEIQKLKNEAFFSVADAFQAVDVYRDGFIDSVSLG